MQYHNTNSRRRIVKWEEEFHRPRPHLCKVTFKRRSATCFNCKFALTSGICLPQYNRVRDESDDAADRDHLVLDEVLMLKPPKARPAPPRRVSNLAGKVR